MNSAHLHFLIPVTLLLLTIFGVGFATNYYLTRAPMPTPTPITQNEVPVLVPATPRATLPPVEKTKAFISENPAFKFKYPRNWIAKLCDNGVGLFATEPTEVSDFEEGDSCSEMPPADIWVEASQDKIKYNRIGEIVEEIEYSVDGVSGMMLKMELEGFAGGEGGYMEVVDLTNQDYNYLFVMFKRENQSAFGDLLTSFQFLGGE